MSKKQDNSIRILKKLIMPGDTIFILYCGIVRKKNSLDEVFHGFEFYIHKAGKPYNITKHIATVLSKAYYDKKFILSSIDYPQNLNNAIIKPLLQKFGSLINPFLMKYEDFH